VCVECLIGKQKKPILFNVTVWVMFCCSDCRGVKSSSTVAPPLSPGFEDVFKNLGKQKNAHLPS